VGCQFLACALNGLSPSFFGQLLARCPGCAHLRHSSSRILLWNSSLEMLNLGRLLVVSSSMGSPEFWFPLFAGQYVPSGFCGIAVSRWLFFAEGDPWICLTVASLVSFRIAHWARASRSWYSSLLASQAFCNSATIPPGSNSPPVESSNSASLATRRNSFQYSVTDRLPFFMFFSLILASPLASITPNCLCHSALNPAQLSHVGVILSSAYGVIQVPASSLRRLVA